MLITNAWHDVCDCIYDKWIPNTWTAHNFSWNVLVSWIIFYLVLEHQNHYAISLPIPLACVSPNLPCKRNPVIFICMEKCSNQNTLKCSLFSNLKSCSMTFSAIFGFHSIRSCWFSVLKWKCHFLQHSNGSGHNVLLSSSSSSFFFCSSL